MVFLPRVKVKKKRYYRYKEAKELVPTKAELLRRALKKALKIEVHAEYIDFIPSKFTLQLHGWFDEDPEKGYTKLSQIQDRIRKDLRAGKDPIKQLRGKWHYDLRVQKLTAPCYDKETEVLTREGWKKFKEVKVEDEIAEYKPESKELVYSSHLGYYEEDFDGEMIGVESQQIDMLVTPRHHIFFNQEIIEAQEVYECKGNFQRIVKNWKSPNQEVDLNLAEFLGFWFAEGSVTTKRKKNPYQYPVLTQSTNLDYVYDLLGRLGLPYRIEKKSTGGYNFIIKDRNLGEEFSAFGKARTKRIPIEYKNFPKAALIAFIEGFTRGDGSRRVKDWNLYSSSKGLLDDLQEMEIKAGYVGNLREHRTTNSFSDKKKWKLSVNKRYGHYPYVEKRHWYKKKYKGKVYCMNMPGDPLIIVRRNGKTLISGRTWFGITLFRAPWTGTIENKVQGTVKGYQSIVPGGKKLEKFLKEKAQRMMATEGIRERQDRIEWMKVKAQWFPIDSPGNPQKNQPAAMIAIEFFKPAILHRRQFDFIDFTFLGDRLKGRYYYRLVERKLSEDELAEYQKKAIREGKAKAYYGLFFYLWKAKKQFDSTEMKAVALLKRKKDPIPAPPSKTKKK